MLGDHLLIPLVPTEHELSLYYLNRDCGRADEHLLRCNEE